MWKFSAYSALYIPEKNDQARTRPVPGIREAVRRGGRAAGAHT